MTISSAILKFFTGSQGDDYPSIEKRTFFLDTARLGVDGIEQTLAPSVFLLIAIQFFQVSDFWKGIISAGIFIGMIISLFSTSLLAHKKPTKVTGLLTIFSGLILILAAYSKSSAQFSLLLTLHNIALLIRIPLFTAMYESNYDPSRRGKLYSAGMFFSIITGLLSNFFFGRILDFQIENFVYIFWFTALLLFISGLLLFKIPYETIVEKKRKNPLKNLSLLIRNPVFGLVSLSWFIMGFANLWSIPLRVVYLAEGERGLGLSPFITLIIIGFIPNAVKLFFNNVWARMFDRFHFLALRMLMSFLIGVGLFLFFLTESLWVIVLGQVIMNLGFAGTPFMWNLWVTKIAPPGESQPYMSVHTFLCGIRGVLGPFAGFLFVGAYSMRAVGTISFVMVLISLLILLPLVREFSSRDK